MRIATSTIYDHQTSAIDNLSAQYQQIGAQLSSGKSLNVPSDDPSRISQDLTIRQTIEAENNDASNATAAQQQLTYTDATLSALTNVLQTARNLAVSGANDIIPNGAQRPLIGKQVEGLLEQALALANAQYGTTYIFAGTGPRTSPPITPLGSPATGVTFTGNNDARTELINGQAVTVGTTIQQAFNQGSTNGTPSVFTLLANLRDTLNKEPAVSQSQNSINVTGRVIYGPTAPVATQTTLAQLATAGGPSALTLTPDSTGNYSIRLDGTTSTGAPGGQTFTFTGADTIATMLAAINAAVANTGVQASWNQASQRFTLTSVAANNPSFLVSDVASPGATNTSNFLAVFGLPAAGSVTTNLSTQIGDIDAVINQVLSSRATIGQQIQNLAAMSSQVQALSVDNTTTKKTYEDTDIAAATSQFTLTQTALQAAYATTTRLEGKSLIDYL
jgi:flagellar hook-associated protein 3 FlgL